jgi:nitrite reductase/ring-hydroxylating ferredoxin subunit
LDDQLQIDPLPVLHVLVAELRALGGTLHQGARLVRLSGGSRRTVHLDDGRRLDADHVVLATGTPVLDRGLHFARLSPMRSYGLAFTGVEPPEGMFLSAGSSSVSLRDLPRPDGRRSLLVGGAGHEVGRVRSPRGHVERLRRWTADHFPQARETHAWSAQDYVSYDLLPVVGALPGSQGRVHVASGFRKWGMSNGVAAAHLLVTDLLGGQTPWGDVLRHRRPRAGDVRQLVSINAKTAAAGAAGLVDAERRSAPDDPSAGDGGVGRGPAALPVGRANVEGTTCAVVALCTHLGGPLRWNDQERTWDCTLHGSRFAPDGAVLEGPATRRLRPAARDGADAQHHDG